MVYCLGSRRRHHAQLSKTFQLAKRPDPRNPPLKPTQADLNVDDKERIELSRLVKHPSLDAIEMHVPVVERSHLIHRATWWRQANHQRRALLTAVAGRKEFVACLAHLGTKHAVIHSELFTCHLLVGVNAQPFSSNSRGLTYLLSKFFRRKASHADATQKPAQKLAS